MRILLVTITTLLINYSSLAQPNSTNLHFNSLIIKDGMPEGTVVDLLQDKEDYIWIATQRGLVRYDGYATKVYDFGIKNPYALLISKILEDSKGQLWVGVTNSLYKYDRANDRFIPYPIITKGIISSITEDRAGNLWLVNNNYSGTNNNIIRLNPANNKEVVFGTDVKGKWYINATEFREVFEDKNQRIWLTSNNGLYEYNAKEDFFIPHFSDADFSKQIYTIHSQEDATQPGIIYFHTFKIEPYKPQGFSSYNSNTNSFVTFRHNAKDVHSIGSDTVWKVQNDSKGRIWVLTAAGLSLFNPVTKIFTNYAANVFKSNFGDEHEITEDKAGNLWCNSTKGLTNFNITTKQFTHYTTDRNSKDGLASKLIHNLMIDRAGILWFGIFQDGMQWIDTKHHRFIKYADDNTTEHLFKGGQVNCFAKAKDGSIWLGTDRGLYHWFQQMDSFQFIKIVPTSDDSTHIYNIFYDSKDLIWFNVDNGNKRLGLYCYNPSTGITISYHFRQNDTTSLASDNVGPIYEDHLGDIWVGTFRGGICRFNRQAQTFTRFPFIRNNFTISDTHGALDDLNVISIYEDKAGTLWVGTNIGGLNRFNRQQGTFTSYVGKQPGFNSILNINEDSKGRLWAGTYFGGLFELNKNRDSINRITEKDGLLYDGVIGTEEDNQGNIWIASARGISILNPATRQIRNITEVNDFNIYSYQILKTNTGDFLIATKNGFISLNPSHYAPDINVPVIHIEELHLSKLVHNKLKDSVLVVASHSSYRFQYNENRITFQYVGLYYQDAPNVQYAYKLDGYDKDWISAGMQRSVTYTNLAPGTYTFHVKAANGDGVWSNDKSMQFIINPPWWKTWWAYLLYAVVFFAAIWLFIAYRSRQLKRVNKILEEKVLNRTKQLKESMEELKATQAQLIQSEKMASLGELTAGIAHEIQNPLNFVNNFAEVNKEILLGIKEEIAKGNYGEVKLMVDDVSSNEEKINYHGKRADSIVKSMLQHSRVSSSKKEPVDINALVNEYVRLAYHGLRAKDKSFDTEIKEDFDQSIGKVDVIPQDISRVLLNLFNNAFYAVNEKKQQLNQTFEPIVSVTTEKKNGSIILKVADNGNGIPHNILDKVFQPFFTTKPTGQGTGLGLSMSYDIIKAHGGEIKVMSKEGEGTTFIVLLPA